MEERQLIITRGLPGSGKSTTLSKYIYKHAAKADNAFSYMEDHVILSADDYFKTGNQYLWTKELLYMAHARCHHLAKEAALREIPFIAIDNTNIKKRDFWPYIELAHSYSYKVILLDLFDGGLTDEELYKRNTHDVPLEVIQRFRKEYYFLDSLELSTI